MIVYHGSNMEIDAIQLEKCNKYKELTNQYSFHTDKAIPLLKKVGVKQYA